VLPLGSNNAADRRIQKSMQSTSKPFPHLNAHRIQRTTRQDFARCFILIAIVASFVSGNAFAQLRGPKITNETQVRPTTRPTIIYVSDFSIDSYDFATAPVKSRLNRGIVRGALDQIKGTDSSPQGQAQAVVDTMSNTIVSELQNKGFTARRVRQGIRPNNGWVVRGKFSTVDQGDRAIRTAVGFGAGSATLNVDVILGEVVGGKEKPILTFGTTNKTGKGPGGIAMAAATKNPYAIAVKYALSGKDLQRNIRKTGKAVADQFAKAAS
jgi:Domain of unknown function (DUF4410)